MPVDIDQDTQAAVKALWDATPGLGAADPSGFTLGPLKAGRLVGGSGTDSKTGLPIPYGYVKVEKARDGQMAGTNGAYYDFRLVTLTVEALEPQARLAMGYMLATFNLKNLLSTGLSGAAIGLPNATTLVLPSGARFWRWMNADHGTKTLEDKQRAGAEIWQAQLKGELASIRTET